MYLGLIQLVFRMLNINQYSVKVNAQSGLIVTLFDLQGVLTFASFPADSVHLGSWNKLHASQI